MNLNPNILIEVAGGAIGVTGSVVGGAQPSKSAFSVSGQCFIPYSINSFLSSDIIFLYQIK